MQDTTATPVLTTVAVSPYDKGGVVGISVEAVWANVDRPNTGGFVVNDPLTAHRLMEAMLAGAVYHDAYVATDVNGNTYVSARSRVMGRYLNADLRKLGF